VEGQILLAGSVSPDDLELPVDPAELRAFAAAMLARAVASEQALAAERTAHDETRERLEAAQNSIKLTALQIEKFKVQLARLRRMKFGQSSERLAAEADQLELTLEDLEAEHAHAECLVEGRVPNDAPATAAPRKPRRAPLHDHLPRDEIMHPAPDIDGCSACGGTMGKLGEDVTEVLEYVPGRFRVTRHVRPKLSCNRCDAISQAPAPGLPVPRGRAGPGLLAHVIVSKFADHLPLYRQSQIYAREGVEISRSTMADWLGQASWLLQPLVDRIADHVMASVKLHADDTPVPVLAPGTGKTATGRLWVYLRDNRRWDTSDRPAALFRYSHDRKGERPREHLKTFAGFLQADAYAGFERLYAPDREPGQIVPVACWAHYPEHGFIWGILGYNPWVPEISAHWAPDKSRVLVVGGRCARGRRCRYHCVPGRRSRTMSPRRSGGMHDCRAARSIRAATVHFGVTAAMPARPARVYGSLVAIAHKGA